MQELFPPTISREAVARAEARLKATPVLEQDNIRLIQELLQKVERG